MPTTVISFLGTGQKLRPEDNRSVYRTTVYRFASPHTGEFTQEASLFGTALIRYLRSLDTDLDRWIILGTSASLWSEVNHILPNPEAVLEDYCHIDDLVAAKNVDAPALQRWQETLNGQAPPLELRLSLIGEPLDPQSQDQIARVLFENTPRGNNVVFDISHGFRHLPVIATFVISLMRWTHDIRTIRFFSGVFEARQDNVTPVIELPICQRLVEATEAAATLELTGNYAHLAGCLGLDANEAWFLENTNQVGNARSKARALRMHVMQQNDVLGNELASLLKERLLWAEQNTFAERMRKSALDAAKHGDYLRAVVLMYEAILSGAVRVLFPNDDPLEFQQRQKAESGLLPLLDGEDKTLFVDLQHTRNACAHGSRSNRASVQQMMQSPVKFRELIERASKLFDRLMYQGHLPERSQS